MAKHTADDDEKAKANLAHVRRMDDALAAYIRSSDFADIEARVLGVDYGAETTTVIVGHTDGSRIHVEDEIRLCALCGEPQVDTPSGVSCPNGHGGAESLDPANLPPIK